MKIEIIVQSIEDWTQERHTRLNAILAYLLKTENYRELARLANLRSKCEEYAYTQAKAQYLREDACIRLEKYMNNFDL